MRVQLTGTNPSAPDVINAFARAYDHAGKMHATKYTIPFNTETGCLDVHITGLSYEHKKVGQFSIEGFFKKTLDWVRIKGSYDATTAIGYLEYR